MSQIKKIQEKLNVFRISRLKSYYNNRTSGLRVLVVDGIEATRQIQSIHPNPPLIIGYTTLQGSHNEKICLEAGMSRIIHKKITFHEIESLIVSIFKKLLNA